MDRRPHAASRQSVLFAQGSAACLCMFLRVANQAMRTRTLLPLSLMSFARLGLAFLSSPAVVSRVVARSGIQKQTCARTVAAAAMSTVATGKPSEASVSKNCQSSNHDSFFEVMGCRRSPFRPIDDSFCCLRQMRSCARRCGRWTRWRASWVSSAGTNVGRLSTSCSARPNRP